MHMRLLLEFSIEQLYITALIWILLNCLLLVSFPVVLIIVIHLCMVLLTLTSLGFSVYSINWPALESVSILYSY